MHAPGHLRDAFEAYVEAGMPEDYTIPGDVFYDGKPRPVRWLLGRLWRCSDIMPRDLCDALEMPQGSTYAAAVQELTAELSLRS